MTVALLMALMALPAVAKGPHAKATGTVEWTAQGGNLSGLTTSFAVHDMGYGQVDKGFWTLDNNGLGTYTVDVICVNVIGDQAWFGGYVTEGTGMYTGRVGAVQLNWVHDVATSGAGFDLLGGAGADAYDGIDKTCDEVEAATWTGKGLVDSGNLKTHSLGG
jgi:hypothetical protein